MHRAHKIKLQPTKAQEQYFARACGTARFAFNWALAEWQKDGRRLTGMACATIHTTAQSKPPLDR